jgi:hypothetical protein
MSENNDELFSLLVNISVSSESTIERLTNSLKVLVDKYFEVKDFTKPENTKDVLFDSILKIEAIVYTLYEIENEADNEPKKLEILYYKDIVLKALFVLTNLDFFVKELKENELFDDACQLREKLKEEFKILANNRNDNQLYNCEEIKTRFFGEIKPQDYRKLKNNNIRNDDVLDRIKNKNLNLLSILKQKIKSKSKPPEPKINSEGKKVIRTATGWEIPADFFEN